jgi:hypothetical protein
MVTLVNRKHSESFFAKLPGQCVPVITLPKQTMQNNHGLPLPVFAV